MRKGFIENGKDISECFHGKKSISPIEKKANGKLNLFPYKFVKGFELGNCRLIINLSCQSLIFDFSGSGKKKRIKCIIKSIHDGNSINPIEEKANGKLNLFTMGKNNKYEEL